MSSVRQGVRTTQLESFIQKWRAKQNEERVIFVLGAGILQTPCIQTACELGLRVHVADGNKNAAARSEVPPECFHHIDLKDTESLLQVAQSIQRKDRLHAVMTVATDFSAPVAYIAEHCSLPGISYESALNASHKDRMKQVLAESGIPVPKFCVLRSLNISDSDSITRIIQSHRSEISQLTYPLVCKPADNMGARGVREIREPEELYEAVQTACAQSRSSTVLLEEKIQDREYSLDSILSGGNFHPMGIARRYIDYPPYFIERGHSFPSDLSYHEEQEMFCMLHKAALALGIWQGAAKGDIFYTSDGPVIGEVAARLSGGYMSGWTFPLHSGINPTLLAILVALGDDIPAELIGSFHAHVNVSERCLISIPGRVESVLSNIHSFPTWSNTNTQEHIVLQENDSKESNVYMYGLVPVGKMVRFPQSNVEKCGNIIATGHSSVAESLVARCFIKLHSESWENFHSIVQSQFPPAFPNLYRLVLHGIKNLDSHSDPEMLKIFEDMCLSTERDWNYRSISDSLIIIKHLYTSSKITAIPCLEFKVTQKASIYNTTCTLVLLRGGAQAALYFIELCSVNSENNTMSNYVQTKIAETYQIFMNSE